MKYTIHINIYSTYWAYQWQNLLQGWVHLEFLPGKSINESIYLMEGQQMALNPRNFDKKSKGWKIYTLTASVVFCFNNLLAIVKMIVWLIDWSLVVDEAKECSEPVLYSDY